AARGQGEAADLAVEGERVRAVADGQHQRGLRAVDAVARGDLGGARLQVVRVGGRDHAFRAAQHREDGADRDVDVDVRRTVERIEQQQVAAARIVAGNRLAVVHLLRRQARQVAAPGV